MVALRRIPQEICVWLISTKIDPLQKASGSLLSRLFVAHQVNRHMSPVGHSLVGLAFAAVAFPSIRSRKWKVVAAIAFVALASLPDWPLPNWGHDKYKVSHSIFVNVALISILIAAWFLISRVKAAIPLPVVLLGSGAWLSHLLLDTFYNHGIGLKIYWPFSEARLNLAIPWFNVIDVKQSILSQHNLSVYGIEFIAYTPILLLTIFATNFFRRKTNGSME